MTEEEKIYNEMLDDFEDTFENASKDTAKNAYMTSCKKNIVKVDKFKDAFIKNMSLTSAPKSCDALCMVSTDEFFMIEFKNGVIDALKNYEIKVKIFESLLMLSERFSRTTEFMRERMNFILVYNENIKHGENQYEDTGKQDIKNRMSKLAKIHIIRFGLSHFKKLYFKDVFTYSKKEFEDKFISKYYNNN
jgi:hypothetical protein